MLTGLGRRSGSQLDREVALGGREGGGVGLGRRRCRPRGRLEGGGALGGALRRAGTGWCRWRGSPEPPALGRRWSLVLVGRRVHVVGVVGAEDGDAAGDRPRSPPRMMREAPELALALDLLRGRRAAPRGGGAGPRPDAVASRSAWRRTVVVALPRLRVGRPACGTIRDAARRTPGRTGGGRPGGHERRPSRTEGAIDMTRGRVTAARESTLLERGRSTPALGATDPRPVARRRRARVRRAVERVGRRRLRAGLPQPEPAAPPRPGQLLRRADGRCSSARTTSGDGAARPGTARARPRRAPVGARGRVGAALPAVDHPRAGRLQRPGPVGAARRPAGHLLAPAHRRGRPRSSSSTSGARWSTGAAPTGS